MAILPIPDEETTSNILDAPKTSLHSLRTRDPVLNSLAESSWVTVRGTERNLLVGVIYRPPSSTEHLNSTLIGVVEYLDRYQYMQIVLMGDFNVPGGNTMA